MAPRLLLLLPTRTYRAAAFLDAAHALGLEVVVGSDQPSTLGAFMAGRELVLDLGHPDQAAARAAAFAAEHRVDGVVGVDETAVLTAAHLAERLGVRHHPVAAVAATRDKRRLRLVMAGAGVPQPDFAELPSDAGDGALSVGVVAVGGFPAVLKPVSLAASQGVIRVDSLAGLQEATIRLGRLLDELDCDAGTAAHPLLLERFVPGVEVAVEGLVRGGRPEVLAVFDKPEPLDGPYFAETLLVTPSRLLPATHAAVTGLATAAAVALGLRDGPFHAELRVDPLGGPRLLEVAARSIGGLCSRVLHFGDRGMGLEEVILRHACGLPLEAALERSGPAATGVLMLPVPASGMLLGVDGVAQAEEVPGIDGVSLSVPRGETVTALPEGDRYLGFVFAHGDSAADVEASLREAWRRLHVAVDTRPAQGSQADITPRTP